jgi:GNAT superfamily N-acetyltransferase
MRTGGDGPELTVVPANRASWSDLTAVIAAARCHDTPCHCQRFKILARDWYATDPDERAHRLREQTDCENPDADATSGLVGYLDGEAVGWCAVQPRIAYPRLRVTRVAWSGRDEDKNDPSVWAITCVLVRNGYRRRHFTYPLVAAAVDHAGAHGARALEGYPMITTPGQDITWGELHVGPRGAFTAAGFRQVARPTTRRVVMRIDFR